MKQSAYTTALSNCNLLSMSVKSHKLDTRQRDQVMFEMIYAVIIQPSDRCPQEELQLSMNIINILLNLLTITSQSLRNHLLHVHILFINGEA